ncbi:MAG TPA: LamG-like jellyroll fold domain-containing protein [Verrucomicrobiae bacterium]|jgi:hypothetical protein|nr:LamG-like jellyroll fold domain-containing protein [Verrucomicrobiae bacterium]
MRSNIEKLIWAALVSALTGVVAHAQTYSNAVIALNPAAYWPLNETNAPPPAYIATNLGTLGAAGDAYYGNPFPDDLGSPASTLFTGPVTGVTSDGDSAAAFPGSGPSGSPTAYMLIPRASQGLNTPAPFTAEAWVEPQGGDPNDPFGSSYASTEWTAIVKQGYGGIFGDGDPFDSNGDGAGWSIALAGIYSVGYPVGWYTPGPTQLLTNATWIVDFFSGNNGNSPSLEFDVPMYEPTPQWFHLVLVYDGTNAAFYTNGVLAATTVPGLPQSTNQVWAPSNAPITTATGAYAFTPTDGVSYVPDTVNPIVLGNMRTGTFIYNEGYPSTADGTIGFNNQIYQGYMDEVAIYTNALSAATVSKHFSDATASNHTLYTNDVLSANPIVYLRLDEPAYTEPDSSTFPIANNYGTMGASANGLYQPGTIPGEAGAPLSGLGPEDYAVRINGFDAGVDVGQQGLGATPLDPTGNTPFSLAYWFKANPADSYTRFQTIIGRGDHGWRSSIDGSGDLRWNPGAGPELASAHSYNDGAWHLFTGVTDGTNAYLYIDGILSTSGTGVGSLPGTPYDVMIGGAPDYTIDNPNGSLERYFAGELAEAAFFTNALTDEQVVALYDAASTPAAIATEPPAITPIPVGQNGIVEVQAVGTQPLSYQWYDNGAPLGNTGVYSGVNSNILTITDAQLAQSGSYFVVVTNLYGAVTSTVSTVIASQIPTILTNPAPSLTNLYAGSGAPLTYTVGAAGVAPFYYQWYEGSSPVSGATATTFTTTATAGTNNYTVVVTNAYGSATSSVFTIVGAPFVAPATGFAVNYNDGGQATGKAGAYQGLGAYMDAPANTNWNVWPPAPGGTTGDAVASSGAASLVSFSIDFGFNNGVNNTGYQGNPCYLVEYEAGIDGTSPGAGTAANPMGTFSFNDVPQGVYTLYVYSANYDGNRGSIITLGADNGGEADGGTNATLNVQSDHTCDTMVEGDNYVFFRGVVPDSNGQISGSYIPNPNGTDTGEGQIDAVQLVLESVNIQRAAAGSVTLNWSGGSLQSANSLTGPWTAVTGTSPMTILATGTNQFFRVY